MRSNGEVVDPVQSALFSKYTPAAATKCGREGHANLCPSTRSGETEAHRFRCIKVDHPLRWQDRCHGGGHDYPAVAGGLRARQELEAHVRPRDQQTQGVIGLRHDPVGYEELRSMNIVEYSTVAPPPPSPPKSGLAACASPACSAASLPGRRKCLLFDRVKRHSRQVVMTSCWIASSLVVTSEHWFCKGWFTR